jgi:hypothetical protein
MPARVLTLVFAMTVALGWATASVSAIQLSAEGTPSTSASPTPVIGVAAILPSEEQVPNDLAVIDDGERTLEDVTSGFSDPDEAATMFRGWGWERNVIRAFHTPADATTDPNKIDGIYISIHEFGSPEEAAEALDYSVEVHLGDTTLSENNPDKDKELGESSRVLFGEQPYGDEITIYARQGDALIRLSASSPEGDPTEEAVSLMEWMIEQAEADQ